MTDTTVVAVVQKIISGGRTRPTGILMEIPGMDVVSQKVCCLQCTGYSLGLVGLNTLNFNRFFFFFSCLGSHDFPLIS